MKFAPAVPHAGEVASGDASTLVRKHTAAGDTYFRTLLALSALSGGEHKQMRVFLDHARNMAATRSPAGLRLALCGIRSVARDLMRKAAQLEAAHWPTIDAQFDADLQAINDGDLDAATLVYNGSEQ